MRMSRGLLPRFRGDLKLEDPLRAPLPEEHVNLMRDMLAPGAFGDLVLRDYQRESFVRALTERWGRIALATNAGKGAIITLLVTYLARQQKKALILCDEVAVFEALRDEVQLWTETIPGLVESGVTLPPEDRIVLAMVPTLTRRVKDDPEWAEWVGTFDGLFLDEADKATGKSWKRILDAAENSEYRIGFSGTFPTDQYGDLLMDELMGPVLVRAKNLELVERGISARPHVLLYGYDAGEGLGRFPAPSIWRGLSGPEKRMWVYEQGIVYNADRHAFISSLIRPGVLTCVIINRIDHGSELEATIPGSRFLDGSSSKAERKATLDEFRQEGFHLLIVTKILDRGTNQLGHAVDLIFASGEGSVRQSLQRIGRGLRRGGGKEFLRLVDVIDRGHPYLHTAAQKRIRLYAKEGFHVDIGTTEGASAEGTNNPSPQVAAVPSKGSEGGSGSSGG